MRFNLSTAILLGTTLAFVHARAEDKVDFNKDILPVLQNNCVKCHGSEKQKGKYRLDQKADAFKGGKSEKAGVVPSKPDESELLRRIGLAKDNDEAMPPEGDRLPEAVVKQIRAWIASGAAWPEGAVIPAVATTPAPSSGAVAATPAAPPRPRPPIPELPKDFKPGAGEAAAIAAIGKSGAAVRPLAQNIPWTELNLRLLGSNVTDSVLAPVKDVGSLVELRLGNTKVTDTGLAAISALKHLQVLSLELTGITDSGVAHLRELSNLTYLNLYGTQVTDAALDHLRGMKHLRSLYLWQTKVTPAGAKRLQEALPLLEINTGAELVPPPKVEEKKDEKKEEKKA